jgi:hypothetical protein
MQTSMPAFQLLLIRMPLSWDGLLDPFQYTSLEVSPVEKDHGGVLQFA